MLITLHVSEMAGVQKMSDGEKMRLSSTLNAHPRQSVMGTSQIKGMKAGYLKGDMGSTSPAGNLRTCALTRAVHHPDDRRAGLVRRTAL